MRVYLSASSAELPRASAAVRALRELGVVVLGADWIDAVAAHGSLGLGLPQDERERIASSWLEHIRACDVLVALVPTYHEREIVAGERVVPEQSVARSDGLVAEVTMARCLGRPVVLSSRVPRARLHPALICAEWQVFSEDDAALRAAYQKARAR